MIVPELIVSDVARSVRFYVERLGFRVVYERASERFALLERDGARLMLEQPLSRDRLFPRAPLEHPYGRGVNLEIEVPDVDVIAERFAAPLLPLEERWYARDADEVHVRQFAIGDPDGYVLRFSQTLGTRPLRSGGGGIRTRGPR